MVLPGIAGMAVQGLLAVCCLGVFYLKRKKEQHKCGTGARTKEEFCLDASKQLAGAGWIHIMNLGFASVLNGIMAGGDQCVWYWINILVDTTLGTGVVYFLLKVAMAFIKRKLSTEAAADFKPGEYRDQDGIIDMHKYAKQLAVWLLVISSMKIMMVIFMFIFSGPLLAFAGIFLAPFLTQPWLKLLVVMILFPLMMDAFQIWMIDNFIKKATPHPSDGEMLEDAEAGATLYVEAAADALLACSHRCEDALTEENMLVLKARVDEALHALSENGQEPRKHERVWSPQEQVDSAADGNFSTHPHPGNAVYATQYKKPGNAVYETMVPPDQAHD